MSDAGAGVDAAAGDGATAQEAGTSDAGGSTGLDATASEGGATIDAAPGPGACVPTGSMGTARSYFYTGALSSGKVLVAGGGNQSTIAFATAELYDPTTGTFTVTGPMSTPRVPALPNSMVALKDGRMLVAGGDDDSCTARHEASHCATSPSESSGRNGVRTANSLRATEKWLPSRPDLSRTTQRATTKRNSTMASSTLAAPKARVSASGSWVSYAV